MDKVQLGKLTLYNGDNMELLKSLPDNAFELAIVDPPYGDAEGFGRAGDERGRIVCSKNSRFEKYKQTDKIGGGIGTDSEGCLIGTRKIVNHAWGAIPEVSIRRGGTWFAKYAEPSQDGDYP